MTNGMLVLIFLTVLIGIVFLLVSKTSSKYREQLRASSASFSFTDCQESVDGNKREFDRINLQWPVILEAGGSRIETRINNINIGGAFIIHPNPLKIGERFDITLDIPDNQQITLEGEVLWNNMSVPIDKVVSRGMGVRFLGISKESRENLTQILRAHA